MELSIKDVLKENKKVIFFLLRFLGAFGLLSLSYAVWLEKFGDEADTFSWIVGRHLQVLFGSDKLELMAITGFPAIAVNYLGKSEVSLYEGCNGMAIMILFFAFVFAYKGRWKDLLWFIPLGFLIIHIFNLGRLALLIHLVNGNENVFHFMHKYLFSLIIYSIVFLLWVFWVRLANKRNKNVAIQS